MARAGVGGGGVIPSIAWLANSKSVIDGPWPCVVWTLCLGGVDKHTMPVAV